MLPFNAYTDRIIDLLCGKGCCKGCCKGCFKEYSEKTGDGRFILPLQVLKLIFLRR